VANNKVIQTKAKKAEQIRQTGVELLGFPQRVKSNLQFLLGQLSKRGIQHLLVEGGPTVIGSFMKENLADEIVVYIVPKILGMVGNADIAGKLDEYIRLCCVDIKRIGSDVRINGLTENGLKAAGISRGKL
jgi:riboflavin biosynthesis pyrimidine reductase